MTNYIGESMVVDTAKADGGAYFEVDHFVWKARDSMLSAKVFYADIENVYIIQGAKKRVDVVLKNKKYYSFFLYKAQTFVDLINAGRAAMKQKEETGFSPMSDEDIDKLYKINQLHKDGILTDSEFEIQKNDLMKKYRK